MEEEHSAAVTPAASNWRRLADENHTAMKWSTTKASGWVSNPLSSQWIQGELALLLPFSYVFEDVCSTLLTIVKGVWLVTDLEERVAW